DAVGVLGAAQRGDAAFDLHRTGVGVDNGEPLRRGDVGLRRNLVLGDGLHHAVGVDAAVAEEGVPAGARRVALRGHAEAGALRVVGGRQEVQVVGRGGDDLVDLLGGEGAAVGHAAAAVQGAVVLDDALRHLVPGRRVDEAGHAGGAAGGLRGAGVGGHGRRDVGAVVGATPE